jgi:hypothetical protein
MKTDFEGAVGKNENRLAEIQTAKNPETDWGKVSLGFSDRVREW